MTQQLTTWWWWAQRRRWTVCRSCGRGRAGRSRVWPWRVQHSRCAPRSSAPPAPPAPNTLSSIQSWLSTVLSLYTGSTHKLNCSAQVVHKPDWPSTVLCTAARTQTELTQNCCAQVVHKRRTDSVPCCAQRLVHKPNWLNDTVVQN